MYGKLSELDLKQLRQALGEREQRLRYLVQLARQTKLPDDFRQSEREVFGCEARVWVQVTWSAQGLMLQLDSESRTILGLLQVLAKALQGASPAEVQAFNLTAYLQALGLTEFVSSSRRNGLQQVVQAIQRCT